MRPVFLINTKKWKPIFLIVLCLSYDIIPLRLVMLMEQKKINEDAAIHIGQAGLSDIPAIAALFTESFEESVRHHCGGILPKPQAMEDVFTLVYQAEPQAALVARTPSGKVVGYCFAPIRLANLWLRAVWRGHVVKWAWRWLTGRYGFGLHPVKVIVMNKAAFLSSSVAPMEMANARILSIAVAAQARGRGVGGLLLAKAIEYFSLKKVARVRLEVRPENTAAISLYKKWNFIPKGYTEDSQGKWLIMYKEMERHDV
jgi:ribosomal protein S18 acetylase RimI-like enzyme